MPSTEIMMQVDGLKIKHFWKLAEDFESVPPFTLFLGKYLRIYYSMSE